MPHALILIALGALSPVAATPDGAATGELTLTQVGDSSGFASVAESDLLNHGRRYWIEPQTRSFARVVEREDGRRVVFNGATGPAFPAIARVLFSPDGTRLAYIGRSIEGETLVLDGEVLATFERGGARLVQTNASAPLYAALGVPLAGQRIRFSPDSQHLAWVQTRPAAEGPGYRIMLDGRSVAEVERVSLLTFTPGSELVWSTCSHRGPGRLVVAGEPGPELAVIGDLAFSADGSSFVYRGGLQREAPNQFFVDHHLIVDLDEPPYAGQTLRAGGAHFSADLSHSALLLTDGEPGVEPSGLVVDGAWLDWALHDTAVEFGPGGQLFYQRGDGVVLFGEREQDSRGPVRRVAFAPTGDALLFMAGRGKTVVVVDEDDATLGPFSVVSALEFSADGAHRSFVAGPAAGPQELYLDGALLLRCPTRIAEARFFGETAQLRVGVAELTDDAWAAASATARAAGVELVRVAASNQARSATAPDGRTHASFQLVQLSEDDPTDVAFELYFNGVPTGERFDQYPAAFAFDEDGVLRFLSRRGTEVLRAVYR